jgi:uncharacterized protein (DUF58 family)
MSRVTSDTGGLSRSALASWLAAVRRIDALLRRPPVVLGLATAVAVAVFVLATPRALPLLGGLVATIAFGVAGPWLSIVGLRGRLDFAADRCRVGDRMPQRTVITRFGHATVAPPVDWPAGVVRDVAAGVVVPTRRGLFPRAGRGPAIASDWPFGITTARRLLDVPQSLIVRPVTSPVRFPAGLVAARRPGRDASTALPGTAGDVIGVRDHRPGDPSRSIHWPQTARRGKLVVCERPGSAAARVRILLVGDAAVAAEERPADETRLDAAVTVVSSLLESWSTRGAALEVAWARPDGTATVYRPRNRHGLDEALDAVACLEEVGPWPGDFETGDDNLSPTLPKFLKKGGRHLLWADLEIYLAVGCGRALAERAVSSTDRQILVAFEPVAIPGVIVLPASAAAAAVLDRAFAEIGHDPDVR